MNFYINSVKIFFFEYFDHSVWDFSNVTFFYPNLYLIQNLHFNNIFILLMFFILSLTIVNIILTTSIKKKYNFPLINSLTFWTTVNILIYLFIFFWNYPIIFYTKTVLINYDFFCSNILALVVIIFLILLFSTQNLIKKFKINFFEYYILMLTIFLGILLLSGSFNLLISYLSLELIALTSYILILLNNSSIHTIESTLKYFILGSIASIFFLIGCLILYLLTGTLDFEIMHLLFFKNYNISKYYLILLNFGLFCIFLTLTFKFALVPFHFWIADIFDSTKSIVLSFLTTLPKIAYFLFLINIFYVIFESTLIYTQQFFIISAIISSIIGVFGALKQTRIKRLLAYSTIFHSSILFAGLSGGTYFNVWSSFFFFFIYIFNIILIWIWLFCLEDTLLTKHPLYFTQLSNLLKKNFIFSFFFIILFLNLAGLPPFLGFFSKFFIFLFLFTKSNLILLVFIFGFLSVIALIYYLRIIKIILFEKKYYNTITTVKNKFVFYILTLLILILIFFNIQPFLLFNLISLYCLNI